MSFLYIGSTGDRAGHSIVTWAIGRRLAEKGLRVGLMKPLGTDPIQMGGQWLDPDVLLFKAVLNLPETFDQICPFMVSGELRRLEGSDEIRKKILSLAHKLSRGKHVLLIMGSKHIFLDDLSRSLSDISLISELKADSVLIDRCKQASKSMYSILSVSSLLKEYLKGIILNRVPVEELEQIRHRVIHPLAQKGIPVTAAIPEDDTLCFQSLGEIREILDGEFLWGEENLEQLVGGMTVGSVDLQGELLPFKRAYNKIILLKPVSGETEDDISLTPRPIAGILLTGGRNPPTTLLEAARKIHLPLMVVKDDTFTALERLEKSVPPLSRKDEFKVRRFTELLDEDGAFDRLFRSLGLVP